MGMSENVGYTPNEIAILSWDNDHENHWVQWGTQHFQTNPHGVFWLPVSVCHLRGFTRSQAAEEKIFEAVALLILRGA